MTQRPVIVLTGARQTGKTSLVRQLFPEAGYVSLDLPHHAAAAENEPETFLSAYPEPLIVDEVQYAPGLFRYIKARIDADRDRSGRFILTGSQKFILMQEVSDSLAGRASILELEPLSFRETAASAASPHSVEDFVMRGGYPELHQKPKLDAREYYASYTATYLERDVRSLLRVGNLRDFERFVRACALRSGNVLNKSALARDVGISASTANEWLSVLEASGQITLLEPWFANRTRSMTKSPKLYMNDSGLMAFFLGLRSVEELHTSPYRGALWETFVASELRKRYALSHPGAPIYFWRDRTKEVDFLLHHGGRFLLLEAKWSESPSLRDAAGFSAVAKAVGEENVVARTILCRTPGAHSLGDGVQAVGVGDAWYPQ